MKKSLQLNFGGGRDIPTRIFGIQELVLLGWVAIPGMLITSGMTFADKYLLGQFLTLKAVAVYSMAVLLSISIGRVFISAILKPNAISLMHALQNQDEEVCNDILRRTELILCSLSGVAVVAYYSLAKLTVVAIFGVKFIDAVPILLALFIAVMIEGMMQFMAQILIQKRKLYIAVINGAVMLLIAIVLNYLLIPVIFIKGAVLTFFLCNLFVLLVVYFEAREIIGKIRFPRWLVLISSAIFVLSFFVPAT
jgi:O-antigen/teichoic acid export membrane protein